MRSIESLIVRGCFILRLYLYTLFHFKFYEWDITAILFFMINDAKRSSLYFAFYTNSQLLKLRRKNIKYWYHAYLPFKMIHKFVNFQVIIT